VHRALVLLFRPLCLLRHTACLAGDPYPCVSGRSVFGASARELHRLVGRGQETPGAFYGRLGFRVFVRIG
jgi:hypothetical protein